MELLEIRSPFDLTSHAPELRRTSAHSYLISCRQFMSVLGAWRKTHAIKGKAAEETPTVGFMTMSADQIWITEPEISKIVAAIESSHSPVSLT